ncbi:MAG: sugar nucleotide-binding protein [Gammaproteobacteria bacterium]|uniref:sugar nucleotide-binding protein n=1 Tax=Pseudomaricurvus alcaniphilus TaxID=1166482 RepID=UPI001409A7E4|nr:sugar nucleotide-binding protein [Gammaproteobacteria bacterium]NHN39723.1 sugar nucleotide-binding protein [Pseudomaricurvus alcaniphilus]
MATKVLIIDAVSSLGQAIYQAFESTTLAVLAPVRSALDWTDAAALLAFIQTNDVSIVVNTAGWSEAPTEAQQQELVLTATALGEAARAGSCSVIQLSSYRVFGGENKSSYDEADTPQPISAAGEAFLRAEQVLAASLEHYICLRLSWVLDITGNAIFHRLLQDLTTPGPELVVTHQRRGAPLSAMEVGRVVRAMVQQIFCGAENWGAIHLASGDPCSSAEITEVVAEILARKGALQREWRAEALSVEQLEELGEPDSAVLTVRRCRDNFGYQVKSWRQGLSHLVRIWLERQKENWD